MTPMWTVGEQILNRHRKVMVRVHQPRNRSDDSMPIRVGIVSEGYLVLIFQSDQPGHRIGAGAIHTDFAVVVHGHERKRRVNDWVDHGDVQSINGVDWLPVRPRRSAQWVDAEFELGAANRI